MKAPVFLLLCIAFCSLTNGEECPKACIEIYDPVCGTDGKTYGNECELLVEKCSTNNNVQLAYNGECYTTEEKCPEACILDSNPLCGSDGKTYGNPCEFLQAKCKGSTAFISELGECKTNVSSSSSSSSSGSSSPGSKDPVVGDSSSPSASTEAPPKETEKPKAPDSTAVATAGMTGLVVLISTIVMNALS